MSQEHIFSEDTILVSKTDTKGKITYVNRNFQKIAGYSEKELIGKPHNIVRHPDVPRIIFKAFWDYLHKGLEINAYVKNRTKDGGYYWVYANVTPSRDVNKKVIGYHSTRRKPEKKALDVVIPLYAELVSAEKRGGMQASEALLDKLLKEKGMSYEEFVFSL